AKLFNLYPKKGSLSVGADADIVVWDPAASKTISAKTHHQNVDFNIFEGMEVTGLARTTLSRGKITWCDGDLRAERGAGRYVKRPAFQPDFAAQTIRNERSRPRPVPRAAE
ncbi:MAG: dihydropyrimidinase, partial [Alphaproteobacteria bacterium]